MSVRTSLEMWLADHGLGQHARKLLDSGIDWDVLADLSDEDLKQLGFSLGDRKRFLKALASRAPDSLRAADAPGEGERRQVTVLFCDLVGSTQLSRRLDPEDLRDVLRAYQQACVEAIQASDGYVARFEGDGVVAYFGYPKAYEDGPIRAVRASFAILGNLAAANTPLERTLGERLDVRVGIHTGTVVVGEIGANGVPEHAAIVGDAPNLAARLQALAPTNAIVVSGDTWRLITGVFPTRDLGAQMLKGIDAPVDAYQVLPEGETVDRFEPRAARGLTPMVGREPELALLAERWRQACAGDMRAVLLSGEPGIGKSRTLRVFRDSIAGEPTQIILMNCSPYHQNSALWPVSKSLERAIGRGRDDSPVRVLAKLEGFLERLGLVDPQSGWVLATLLALPAHQRYAQLELSAEELRQRTLGAIIALTGAVATVTPLLLVVEDAQWSDASTLELIALMLERLAAARLLVLITARPEFVPRGEAPHTCRNSCLTAFLAAKAVS
jgi:class 3 adenylate cyclase